MRRHQPQFFAQLWNGFPEIYYASSYNAMAFQFFNALLVLLKPANKCLFGVFTESRRWFDTRRLSVYAHWRVEILHGSRPV